MPSHSERFTESTGRHDHDRCVRRALTRADRICADRKLRLTPLRRRVLELIWSRHAPIGAYDILASLKPSDGAVEPPTVYRALKFLQSAGLVHRVDSLNAFIGCDSSHDDHAAQLLVCRNCNRVVEVDDPGISRVLVEKANALGFTTDAQDVEIKGLCNTCRD